MHLTLTLVGFKVNTGDAPQQSSITLDQGAITIGRANTTINNDWNLPDPGRSLSRQHCRIEHRDDDFILTDLSLNGVYVNGAAEKLGKDNTFVLHDGDHFSIGNYLIQTRIGPAESETTAKATFQPVKPAAPATAVNTRANTDVATVVNAFFNALGVDPPDTDDPQKLTALFTQAGLLARFALTAKLADTDQAIDAETFQKALHAGLRAAADALRDAPSANSLDSSSAQTIEARFYLEYLRCYKDQQGLQHTLGYLD